MKDGSLSPVFNIRGGCRVGEKPKDDTTNYYSIIDLYDE